MHGLDAVLNRVLRAIKGDHLVELGLAEGTGVGDERPLQDAVEAEGVCAVLDVGAAFELFKAYATGVGG